MLTKEDMKNILERLCGYEKNLCFNSDPQNISREKLSKDYENDVTSLRSVAKYSNSYIYDVLTGILENILLYGIDFPNTHLAIRSCKELIENNNYKPPRIFLSHSSNDLQYVEPFVDLLESVGINHEYMFCSSVNGYHIPLGKEIFTHLKEEFIENKLFVIFLLSDNYYKSPSCLNEMGASWILNNKYQSILLPEFDYSEIKGSVNPREICFKLDEADVGIKLTEFKNRVLKFLGIVYDNDANWERKRNAFLKTVKEMACKEL